jgi:hypothetical protein
MSKALQNGIKDALKLHDPLLLGKGFILPDYQI